MKEKRPIPIAYDLTVAGMVIGTILTVGAGFYGFAAFSDGWLHATVCLCIAALCSVLLFFSTYRHELYLQKKENGETLRQKARLHAAQTSFFTAGGTGIGGVLVVLVHLMIYFSRGNLVRAAVCVALDAVVLSLGILFKKKYDKL